MREDGDHSKSFWLSEMTDTLVEIPWCARGDLSFKELVIVLHVFVWNAYCWDTYFGQLEAHFNLSFSLLVMLICRKINATSGELGG